MNREAFATSPKFLVCPPSLSIYPSIALSRSSFSLLLLCDGVCADGKDQEMQIGHPTDVKHVAHVGCDGSSNHSPSWVSINIYQ
uniref:CRIB domain-containing protein n=2 Tax=Musa acuminata subsp. malaccensis TaxID=214687 RepID=A0A804HTT6_MUSAM